MRREALQTVVLLASMTPHDSSSGGYASTKEPRPAAASVEFSQSSDSAISQRSGSRCHFSYWQPGIPVAGSDISVTGSDISVIGSNISVTGSDISVIGSNISVIGSDISVIGSDISVIVSEISVKCSNISATGSDISVIGSDVSVIALQSPCDRDVRWCEQRWR